MDSELNNIINKDTRLAQNEIDENNEQKLPSTKSDKSKKVKETEEKQFKEHSGSNIEPTKAIPIQDRAEFTQLTEDSSDKIHFYNSTLSEQDCFLIAEKLKSNKHCTLLSLGNSQVRDEALMHICEAIKSNQNLITIGLGNNQITEKGLFYLGEALKSHKSLITIGLGNNLICNSGIKFLCEGLKENKVFQDLLLYNNKISSKGCEYLKDLLTWDSIENAYLGNRQIKKLYLGSNKIKNEGISFLSQALKLNTTLENLGLSHCEIDDDGIISFAESLASNENSGLKYLALGNNLISSFGAKPLFQALSGCKKIEEVSMEWNLLDDNCAEDVIEFLRRSGKNIKRLLLNNNTFTDCGLLKISEFVLKSVKANDNFGNIEGEGFGLEKLEYVVLSNNNISEVVKGEINKMILESKCSKIKIK